jgi:cell division protein DivIC
MNSAQSMTSLPKRPSRKPRIILIFLIALCGIFVYSYTARLMEKAQLESQIAQVQARIDGAKTEQLELLAQRDKLDQPEYIDWVAREIFGWVKPGDTALMVIKEPVSSRLAEDVSAAATAISAVDLRNLPVWQQWVVFFTTESFALAGQ